MEVDLLSKIHSGWKSVSFLKIASEASKIYYEIRNVSMSFDAKINNIFGAKIQMYDRKIFLTWKLKWDF